MLQQLLQGLRAWRTGSARSVQQSRSSHGRGIRAGAVTVAVLALGVVPVVSSNQYLLLLMAVSFVYAAFAGAWAVQSGFTGYLNLGYAMFVGLGAYVAANLDVRLGAPIWVTIVAATAAAYAYSIVFGLATLRIKSHYIILATLAAVTAMEGTAHVWRTYTRGEDGISGVTQFGSPSVSYLWALGFMVVCGAVMILLTGSHRGLMLHAIRQSEDTARAAGVNTVRYRLSVFSLSAAIGGAGGAMLVHILGYAGTHTISLELSLTVLVYGVVGGSTTVLGPMAAAIILMWAGEVLRAYGDFRTLMEAVILVLAIRFMPQGIGPVLVKATEAVGQRLAEARASSPSRSAATTRRRQDGGSTDVGEDVVIDA